MNVFAWLPYEFTPWQWAAVIFCGLCIGMSKTGFTGITTVIIPFMAIIFGAKESTGVLLPMLCFADLLAVIYYRRAASWKHILRLLPWALAGFAVALVVDRFIPPRGFKILIGACILVGLVVMIWNEKRGENAPVKGGLRTYGTAAFFGILGGFTTMIGNAAGPIMSVFLLSMRLPKTSFVGTGAWFFLIVNYLKLPLQHFVWHNISRQSLILDLFMVPLILIGAFFGILLVKKISEAHFRIMIYVLTVVSAGLLFL